MFVILSWNAEDYLEDCLRSILALSSVCPVIYIADNGSSDGTKEILRSFEESERGRIFVTYLEENRGTTYPRNLLLRQVPEDSEYICVLDSDTVVNDCAIARLAGALEADEKTLVAVPRMWDGENVEQLSCKRFPTPFGKLCKAVPFLAEAGAQKETYSFFPDESTRGNPPVSEDSRCYEVDYGISACWFMKREILDRVGYLDERYFYAPEDVDYCAAVWKHGFRVVLASGASIYHLTQRLSHRKLFSRINVEHLKGLLYFFRKNREFLRGRRKSERA